MGDAEAPKDGVGYDSNHCKSAAGEHCSKVEHGGTGLRLGAQC